MKDGKEKNIGKDKGHNEKYEKPSIIKYSRNRRLTVVTGQSSTSSGSITT